MEQENNPGWFDSWFNWDEKPVQKEQTILKNFRSMKQEKETQQLKQALRWANSQNEKYEKERLFGIPNALSEWLSPPQKGKVERIWNNATSGPTNIADGVSDLSQAAEDLNLTLDRLSYGNPMALTSAISAGWNTSQGLGRIGIGALQSMGAAVPVIGGLAGIGYIAKKWKQSDIKKEYEKYKKKTDNPQSFTDFALRMAEKKGQQLLDYTTQKAENAVVATSDFVSPALTAIKDYSINTLKSGGERIKGYGTDVLTGIQDIGNEIITDKQKKVAEKLKKIKKNTIDRFNRPAQIIQVVQPDRNVRIGAREVRHPRLTIKKRGNQIIQYSYLAPGTDREIKMKQFPWVHMPNAHGDETPYQKQHRYYSQRNDLLRNGRTFTQATEELNNKYRRG